MTTYLLGIDVGTSGIKALLVDAQGAVVAGATQSHPLSCPRPLWSEQSPQDWWRGTIHSIREVIGETGVEPGQIAGIGLTGQMHGLVLLDKGGAVLRPAILWNDQRTAAECAAITGRVGAKHVLKLTGNPVLPGFTAPKIEWVRRHEPHVFRRAAKALLPKDYIRHELTGEFFSEVSDASGTSLFDVGRRRWSGEMIQALKISPAWLPEVTESPVASAKISAAAAKLTGLLEGTPVIGGGGDQAAQAVGAGIIEEGLVGATLGTSGVVFAASKKYRVEPGGKLHAFCHAVPGQWHLMGVMLSAAGSYKWFHDALGYTGDYNAMDAGAARVPAGCEGLLFLPYLTGERTPYADPDARGVFFGLTLRHGKKHLTRAVMEGVSYGLRDSLELMRELGLSIKQVRASGGGAKSALWRQMLADVFGAPIATVNVAEGAAYGAALLAGVGAGVYRDVAEACRRAVKVTSTVKPGQAQKVYADFYPRYRALYPALAPEFKKLTKVVAKHLED